MTAQERETIIRVMGIQSQAMPREVLDRALRQCATLLEMAVLLKLPVAVSEQYPKGLGSTVPMLKEVALKVMPPARFIEKTDFSLCGAPLFDQFLGAGRKTWIVAGLETHICVLQTVRDLCARGYVVHVPVDACVSRRKLDWKTGAAQMAKVGAVITTTETVLFDLVKRAQGEEFRALSRLVK